VKYPPADCNAKTGAGRRTYGYLSNATAGKRIVIKGVVTENVELSQRQAVVRDGHYFFLGDKTSFGRLLKEEVNLKELKTLESLE
jgi:hypothetical protein